MKVRGVREGIGLWGFGVLGVMGFGWVLGLWGCGVVGLMGFGEISVGDDVLADSSIFWGFWDA
jgi:hypothetical protein